jgi:hypothetical protein
MYGFITSSRLVLFLVWQIINDKCDGKLYLFVNFTESIIFIFTIYVVDSNYFQHLDLYGVLWCVE